MNIAIVRLSSLGDIIFCMACLQVIRRHIPHAKITWVADSKFADILDHNPDLHQVIKMDLKSVKRDFSFAKAAAEYRKLADAGKFDVVIDLHGMIKSALIARKLGKKTFGFARDVAKEPVATFLYDATASIDLEMNTVLRYTTLAARGLGIDFAEEELKEKEPFLFHAPEDEAVSKDMFRTDKKNVIFVVGSTWESRNYPKERFVTIANALKENILIAYGNASEFETAQYIAEHSPYATILPKMTINQLKGAISRADLLIGGDTGPTHMAWANNVPCVVIFGPTPAHRIYPGPACKILKSSTPVFERKLNKNDFSIREIEAPAVIALAEELLASGGAPARRRVCHAL